MKPLRLFFSLLLAALAVLVCVSVVLAAPAPPRQHNVSLAPPQQITTCQTISVSLVNTTEWEWINAAYGEPTITGPGAASVFSDMATDHGGSNYYIGGLSITYTDDITFTSLDWITITVSSDGTGLDGANTWSVWYTDSTYDNILRDAAAPGGSLPGRSSETFSLPPSEGKQLAYFSAAWERPWWSDKETSNIQYDSIYIYTCQEYDQQQIYDTCATVSDHHFTGAVTDTWLLSGSAAISNSILTLPAGDAAGQNLDTLSSNTEYNAVVSVTNEITASLLLVLGVETDTLDITGPGIYTASLTTPNLGGPIAYILENQATETATLEIDLTCLYSTADEDERVCLAPDNGEFEGGDDWNWYRGAAYQPLLENAYLPYNEGAENTKSLVVASATYTLPTLETGESLLLSFESETQYNQAGVLGARVDAGITDTTYYFEIYPYVYEFQADISNLAGESGTTLAFANTGEDPVTGFAATDNLYLDNVCIYVSETEAELPGPVDTDPVLSPGSVENWTCYGCDQISGILYNYGLSVYYLEEMYNNGVSIWDYSGWVPWLAAALWVNAGFPLACWLLGLWCWWLGLLQYLLWEFLNWAWWLWRTSLLLTLWLALMILWVQGSVENIMTNGQAWLLWAVQAALDFLAWLYDGLWALIQWIGQGFIWLASNIAGFDFLIQLWNLAVPLLQTIWSFLSGLALLWLLLELLLAFFNAAGALLVMLISWAWVNIFEGISLPIEFYQAFNQGIADSSFSYLLSCSDQNFWCSLLAGFQLVNESAGQNIIYPAVIVLIITTTIWIFWNDIKALFSVKIQ